MYKSRKKKSPKKQKPSPTRIVSTGKSKRIKIKKKTNNNVVHKSPKAVHTFVDRRTLRSFNKLPQSDKHFAIRLFKDPLVRQEEYFFNGKMANALFNRCTKGELGIETFLYWYINASRYFKIKR